MDAVVKSADAPSASALNNILGELSVESFQREYLGKRFVALPGPAKRFAHLFSWDAINYILENQMFSGATLRMKKAGEEIPLDSFLTEFSRPGRGASATRISANVITRELRDGATLIMNEIQNWWPPVRDLATHLEEVLEARININMYATLYEKHGFPCHYDVHDVLILQCDGKKRWQIFERRPTIPFPDDKFNTSERPPVSEPLWDELLTDGAALYLPRGMWHFARPVGESSVHLTVGIVNPTGRELCQWLLQQLSTDNLLRLNLPQWASAEEADRYLAVLRDRVMERLSRPDILDAFARARSIADGAMPRRLFWTSVVRN